LYLILFFFYSLFSKISFQGGPFFFCYFKF